MDSPHAQARVGFWEVLAFACELAMLAALGTAGWLGADGTPPRIALMLALPAVAIAVWGVWMAPRSPRRLPTPWRPAAEVVLYALAGAALLAVGHGAWGAAVTLAGVVDTAVLAARERVPAAS